MLRKKLLKPKQLLGNAFDHVQPVHAEHHFPALKSLPQLIHVRLDAFSFKRVRKPPGIDANGKRSDSSEVPVVLYAFGGAFEA